MEPSNMRWHLCTPVFHCLRDIILSKCSNGNGISLVIQLSFTVSYCSGIHLAYFWDGGMGGTQIIQMEYQPIFGDIFQKTNEKWPRGSVLSFAHSKSANVYSTTNSTDLYLTPSIVLRMPLTVVWNIAESLALLVMLEKHKFEDSILWCWCSRVKQLIKSTFLLN